MRTILHDYLLLTKPTIMLLVLFTGATALVIEGSLLADPFKFIMVLVALYLTGGCANALNQYFERDIDATMARTSQRRPLPLKKIAPWHALVFSISIGVVGVAIFAYLFNWAAALMSLGTILFYSLFYTLYLKPNTSQNIVIGGAAGAMAPVGAWVAASGSMAVTPWLMFAIVFLWTPPHFWALAMFCKEDYVKAGLPMMPVAKGDESTLRQILIYTVAVSVVSLLLFFYGVGWIYLIAAIGLSGYFVVKSVQARQRGTEKAMRGLFGYSIVYLFALFAAMIVDKIV